MWLILNFVYSACVYNFASLINLTKEMKKKISYYITHALNMKDHVIEL